MPSPAAPTHTIAELVEQARAEVPELSPAELAAELRGDVLLVDVREQDERVRNGTILGSVHVPRGVLEFAADPTSPWHDPLLEPGRRTLLFCAVGARSALDGAALRRLGYRDVAHLAGGLDAWKREGLPLAEPATM